MRRAADRAFDSDGPGSRFAVLVKELIELKPDVIVTAGPQAIRAVKQATARLLVVMAVILDPVAEGFVQSLQAHRGPCGCDTRTVSGP
jgi:putative ABC transport system substrate-binding protein